MGWCSATEIFDKVLSEIDHEVNDEVFSKVAMILGSALQNQDWDCESDSDYWEDERLKKVWSELCPEE